MDEMEALAKAHRLMSEGKINEAMCNIMDRAKAEDIPPGIFIYCMLEVAACTCALLSPENSSSVEIGIFTALINEAMQEKFRG